jgi:hypothetical protein
MVNQFSRLCWRLVMSRMRPAKVEMGGDGTPDCFWIDFRAFVPQFWSL